MICPDYPQLEAVYATIDPEWREILAPVLTAQAPHLAQLLTTAVLPAQPEQIFAAVAQPPEATSVLIVGQDPYPTPGHAMGLAFSTAPAVAPPRSLHNIYQELATDIGQTLQQQDPAAAAQFLRQLEQKTDGDISIWQQRSVMLLNRVLTVAPGAAGSHRGRGWEPITEAVVAHLARRQVVAVLWGKQAQSLQPLLKDCPVIASAHPSPLSARRGFFGSRPFSRVNSYLHAQGRPEVDWSLTPAAP